MSMTPEQRSDLRRDLLARRLALAPERRVAADQALCHQARRAVARHLDSLGGAAVIGCYWPVQGEPDLRSLWGEWPVLALPRVRAKAEPLEFVLWSPGCRMGADTFGMATPIGTPAVTPTLLIIPCLGFFLAGDDRVYRLGYGGGFYDRTLAQRRVATIGVAYDEGRLSSFTPQAHDIALDTILIPQLPD